MTIHYLGLGESDRPDTRVPKPKTLCAGDCGEIHTCAACKAEYCEKCRRYVHATCPKGEKP